MEHTDLEPGGPEPEYGWRENKPPERKYKADGAGRRILLGMAGVALIAFGLVSLFGAISVTSSSTAATETEIYFEFADEDEEYMAMKAQEAEWAAEAAVAASIAAAEEAVANAEASIAIAEAGIRVPVMSERVGGGSSLSTAADISEVDEISINAAAAELVISGYSGDELVIAIETYNNVEYYVETAGGSVVIDSKGKYDLKSSGETDSITLNVPFWYAEDIKIKLAAGQIYVSELAVGKLKVEVSAGEVVFDAVACDSLELEVAAGSATGVNLSAQSLNIRMSQGELNLAGNLGTTYCESVAAEVYLDYDAMPDAISVNASLGSTELYLPDNARFKLNSQAVMGSVENELGSHPDADSEISINMTMGSAGIRRK